MTHTQYLNIGVLLYGCGHHQAAWRMHDSSIDQIGDTAYYKSLARLAERGLLDAIFLQIINLFLLKRIMTCLLFGLTH